MVTFIAFYRGETVNTAQMIAVSTQPDLVSSVAKRLLSSGELERDTDPVREAVNQGRRTALRLITEEMNDV